MIKGNITKISEYENMFFGINQALSFLNRDDLVKLKDGRYEISGADVYANIQTYQTKIDADFEAHREYIDLQFVVSGREKIGVASIEDCETITSYDAEKDIEFLSTKKFDYVSLNKNEFLILTPKDAHQPSICIDRPETVKKIVIKIKV